MALAQDLYLISVAARMLGMHPQTLRKYERLGLVQPPRTLGSMRVYTGQEIERLRFIKHLVDDVGVNLAGVQRLLSVAEVVERMRPLAHDEHVGRSDAAPASGCVNSRPSAGSWDSDRDGLQGLLPDARAHEVGDRQGDQEHVPEAGAQAPPGRQSGRQGRRVEVQGDQRGLRGARRRRQAEEIRRAGRQLADVRAGAARRAPASTRRAGR